MRSAYKILTPCLEMSHRSSSSDCRPSEPYKARSKKSETKRTEGLKPHRTGTDLLLLFEHWSAVDRPGKTTRLEFNQEADCAQISAPSDSPRKAPPSQLTTQTVRSLSKISCKTKQRLSKSFPVMRGQLNTFLATKPEWWTAVNSFSNGAPFSKRLPHAAQEPLLPPIPKVNFSVSRPMLRTRRPALVHTYLVTDIRGGH